MSLQADVHIDVRRIRERFLCEGSLEAETLPPSVLDSWRRSQAMRVHPDRLDLPYVRQPNTDSRLAHAAEPVLQGATQDVTIEAMSVILTSADGVVIDGLLRCVLFAFCNKRLYIHTQSFCLC